MNVRWYEEPLWSLEFIYQITTMRVVDGDCDCKYDGYCIDTMCYELLRYCNAITYTSKRLKEKNWKGTSKTKHYYSKIKIIFWQNPKW